MQPGVDGINFLSNMTNRPLHNPHTTLDKSQNKGQYKAAT